MPPLNDHPSSRLSRNGEQYKQNHGSVSPRVYLKIKPASQQQEDNDESTKKTFVYGGIEKRSSALEFKTSGKYLGALKQILETSSGAWRATTPSKLFIAPPMLETMQTTRRVLENKEQSLDSQKSDQSGSPTKMATETMMMAGIHNANHMAKKAGVVLISENLYLFSRLVCECFMLPEAMPTDGPTLKLPHEDEAVPKPK
ncbi:hypothetical protein Tco_0964468 [Tanacetum coccineum]